MRVPPVVAAALARAILVALALASAVGLAGCNKVPLTAPSSATITLYANTSIVPLNGTAQITATVIQKGGTSVHDGTLVSFTTSLGTVEPVEAETDNGKVTVTFKAGTQSGTAVINAYSGGVSTSATTSTSGGSTSTTTSTTSGSGLTLLVGAAAASSVVVAASPGTVPGTGGTSTITATVLDTNNNLLPGVPVSFSTDLGTVSPTTATSDSNGQAKTTLTTYQTSTVTASVGSKITGTTKVTATAAPTITISTSTTTPAAGDPTTFNVTITVGADGAPITKATIDFGDSSGVFDLGATSGTFTANHIYKKSGTFTVTVTAKDASGQTTSASVPVTVFAAVPFTLTVTAASGRVGIGVTMTAAPPAGAPTIVKYVWDFGDGETLTTATGSTSHVYLSIPSGQTYYQYTVYVVATGSDGRTGYGSATVTISQ